MEKIYKFLCIIVFSTTFVYANDPVTVETKIIDKSFTVNQNADLLISNKYGNVSITTWDKNVVSFHIEIKVDGKKSEEVKARINSINIEFTNHPNSVTAETIFKNIKGKNNTNITIHYTVKLPKNNNLTVKNKYGNLNLDLLNGTSNIELDYGNMNIGSLNNSINNIDLDYVTQANLEFVKSANIVIDYGKINIGKAEILNFDGDYSDANIGTIEDLIINLDYGNLNIEQAKSVSYVADYSNVKINHLSQSFISSSNYGAISINKIKEDFNKISIGAEYSDVSLGILPGASYTLNANFKYGSLSYPDHVKMSKIYEKTSVKNYEGKIGNGTSEILINLTYGNAKIN